MNKEHHQLVSRIRGEVDMLLTYPLSGRPLGHVQLWAAAYESRGLGFSTCTAETQLLREMAAAGLVATDGKTKSQGHKLTWAGLVATEPDGGRDAAGILANLAHLAAMPPHDLYGIVGVEGFRLCPSLVALYHEAEPDLQQCCDEIGDARGALGPMVAMKWAAITADGSGEIWAASVTDAGRQALANPPDTQIEAAAMFDFDAWQEGFDSAERYATTQPPAWLRNCILRTLSTGGAWAGVKSTTVEQARRELAATRPGCGHFGSRDTQAVSNVGTGKPNAGHTGRKGEK